MQEQKDHGGAKIHGDEARRISKPQWRPGEHVPEKETAVPGKGRVGRPQQTDQAEIEGGSVFLSEQEKKQMIYPHHQQAAQTKQLHDAHYGSCPADLFAGARQKRAENA